jgi:hypothetical protein
MAIAIHNLLFKPINIEKDISYTELIQYISPYMLTLGNKKALNNNINETIIENTQQEEETPKKEIINMIEPKQKDTLFWCLYILLNDYGEYTSIHHNYNMRELEWKHELSKEISKNPTLIKNSNHKVTKAGVQEILSDLMSNIQTTNIACLIAITVYRNINIIVMNHSKKLRMEFSSGDNDNNFYIIYKNDNNRYSVQVDSLTEPELIDIRNSSYLIDNENKPLKSIGSYKVDELIQMVKLFDAYNDNTKYKKNDLYLLLGEYITPFII